MVLVWIFLIVGNIEYICHIGIKIIFYFTCCCLLPRPLTTITYSFTYILDIVPSLAMKKIKLSVVLIIMPEVT